MRQKLLKDKIVYAMDIMPKDLDVLTCSDYMQYIIISALTRPLFKFDNDSKQYVGISIRSVNISENRLNYTFDIEDNMKWSNGEIISAEEYLNAFYHILELGHRCPIGALLEPIKNWDEVSSGKLNRKYLGLKLLGRFKFQIELEYPMPYIYELLSTPYITPMCIDENGMLKKYAGAYCVKLQKKNKIVLEKNKNFENKEIETIEFKVFPSMHDALQQYDKGVVDITCNTQFPYNLVYKYSKREDFHVIKNTGLFFTLRTNDFELKKTLQSGIEKNSIAKILNNAIRPINSLIFNDEDNSDFIFKSKKRLQILNNTYELIYSRYYPNEIIANMIKKQLERKGVNLILKCCEYNQLIDKINNNNFQIALDIVFCCVKDPIAICMQFANCLDDRNFEELICTIENFYNGRMLDKNNLKRCFYHGLNIVPLFALNSFQLIKAKIKSYKICENGYIDFNA